MNHKVVHLVNLTDKPFNFTFCGVSYTVPVEDGLDVTEDCAYHARKKSIMMYDLETGKARYQVGVKGVHDLEFLGEAKKSTDELIDRETDPLGEPTTINVRGGQVRPGVDLDALVGGE